MHITRQLQQVFFLVYTNRLESSLKQRADPIVTLIDRFGVGEKKRLHQFCQVVMFDENHQMIVIGHQTVSDNVNNVCFEVLADLTQEEKIIFALKKDSLMIVAAIVEMIISALIELDTTIGRG